MEIGIGMQFLEETEESDPLHTFGVPVDVRIKAGSGMSQADRSSPSAHAVALHLLLKLPVSSLKRLCIRQEHRRACPYRQFLVWALSEVRQVHPGVSVGRK